jgi:hypothetical protein
MVQANIKSPSGICSATEISILQNGKGNTSFAFCFSDMPHCLVDFKVVVLRELHPLIAESKEATILMASFNAGSSRISTGI